MKAYHIGIANKKKGEFSMDEIIAERALEKFKRESYYLMKKYEHENEYNMLKPYFEEAMNKLPEDRKEMFYLSFGYRLNDLEIAKKLDMRIIDVIKEIRESVIIVLKAAEELFLKDHSESIDESI